MTKRITGDVTIVDDENPYLKYLPPHLRDAYLEGFNDAQLTSLRIVKTF